MFRPGHVELRREPAPGEPGFQLSLEYRVCRDEDGCHVDFELDGDVAGQPVHDGFSLRRDVAYNFLQSAGRCLRRRGIKPAHPALFAFHEDYNRVFADLRRQLRADPGEPVDLERFLLDRGEAMLH
ncbi:DUF5064 family protein [Pseudomonas sp. PDM15]|jgi:hypothetical protein|uniref:DUF5064 family protein n=1 Tax=Pseudomonas sp. PDM15 TaxID=2769303 RepID=UPI0017838AC3|nr:DUF5064 family protein [Pseudomonas sp. PDM15]MBD9427203.1 DUF5064 family protein [Pseudomonas sp. PDM15]